MNNNTRKGNIQIVDDVPENLDVLSSLLAKNGYETRMAISGELALKSIRTAPPDLILLDVMMPGLSGLEVCERLKADRQTRDIPVIFISALDEKLDKVRAFSAGGVDYITKPFQEEEVLARVETHLALRREIDRRARAEEASRRHNEYLEALHKTSLGLLKGGNSAELLENIVARAARLVRTSHGFLHLRDNARDELEMRVGLGRFKEAVVCRMKRGEGLAGKAWQTGQPVIVDDYQTWEGRGRARRFDQLRACVAVPLASGAGAIGVGRFGRDDRRFDPDEVHILTRFAQLASIVLDNARLQDELLRAKDAAEAANRAKSVFLANMSHELRTPLNAILGFSQLLGHGKNFDPEERKNLEIIHASGEHLLNLINDVLDMSKIEAGRAVLSPKDFDLHRLLDGVEDMFRLKAEEKGLQLTFERDAGVPGCARADEGKLRQVLVNLLGNALKFTQKGRVTARVSTRVSTLPTLPTLSTFPTLPTPPAGAPQEERQRETAPTRLQFEIEDTGEGVAPDELDSLFDAFVQTGAGRRFNDGTGLGLPISRKFVQLMGGDITVESAVGKGSVFRFQIRVEAAENVVTKTARPGRRVIALAPGQPRYRILIVDDVKFNRRLLRRLLSLPGLALREAENGREAVEIREEWDPHLILMDMRMPIMDGFEATKKIRAATRGRPPVIIAVTAGAFEEKRAAALAAGCDEFVLKPFKKAEIFDMMRRRLGARYVYENNPDAPDAPDALVAGSPARGARKPPPPRSLGALPPDVLARLKQAAVRGDTDKVDRLINDIRAHDAPLADSLSALADNFDHEKILNLIKEAEN
ncbi:MAG: response regulator [Desulfobacterales bacterium]|nr:response regulator [Desulfobacterales bacterium]